MRGSIFKRGERWSVRFDEPTEDGKRRQRRKGGFATRREAQEWLAEQQTRIRDGSYTAPSKITVADFLTAEWLPAIEGEAATSHLRALRQHRPARGRSPDRPQAPTGALGGRPDGLLRRA